MGTLLRLLARLSIGAPIGYLYVLALASMRRRTTLPAARPRHRFAVAIPAHNEAAVIAGTLEHLKQLDYPTELFEVHVVADHCSDMTAQIVRAAGAVAHERAAEPRGNKGSALRWLFKRVLADPTFDAVVVFDADTHVEPDFLRLMAARLEHGDAVIQGQHRIRNADDGWLPALIWATFVVDNRLQNLGRTVLGCSAKNMGDSICVRADLLRRLGWGEGLTDDYAFRQQLLLEGVKISYEPAAVGRGEAPLTLAAASAQRRRWLRGTHDASRNYAGKLLLEGLRRRDLPLIDGALQASLPSYSSLTAMAAAAWLASVVGRFATHRGEPAKRTFFNFWAALAAALLVYPLLGLALERAPMRAYLAILAGPGFVVWRTWLALGARSGGRDVVWVRTPRKLEGALAPKVQERRR